MPKEDSGLLLKAFWPLDVDKAVKKTFKEAQCFHDVLF